MNDLLPALLQELIRDGYLVRSGPIFRGSISSIYVVAAIHPSPQDSMHILEYVCANICIIGEHLVTLCITTGGMAADHRVPLAHPDAIRLIRDNLDTIDVDTVSKELACDA